MCGVPPVWIGGTGSAAWEDGGHAVLQVCHDRMGARKVRDVVTFHPCAAGWRHLVVMIPTCWTFGPIQTVGGTRCESCSSRPRRSARETMPGLRVRQDLVQLRRVCQTLPANRVGFSIPAQREGEVPPEPPLRADWQNDVQWLSQKFCVGDPRAAAGGIAARGGLVRLCDQRRLGWNLALPEAVLVRLWRSLLRCTRVCCPGGGPCSVLRPAAARVEPRPPGGRLAWLCLDLPRVLV